MTLLEMQNEFDVLAMLALNERWEEANSIAVRLKAECRKRRRPNFEAAALLLHRVIRRIAAFRLGLPPGQIARMFEKERQVS